MFDMIGESLCESGGSMTWLEPLYVLVSEVRVEGVRGVFCSFWYGQMNRKDVVDCIVKIKVL